MLKVAIILVIALLSGLSQAASPRPTKFIFINGVWNFDKKDGVNSAAEMTAALNAKGVAMDGGSVEHIFNPGDGRIVDVLEVFARERKFGWTLYDIFIGNSVTLRLAIVGYIAGVSENLTAVVDRVELAALKSLKNGTPVVLIGHSQGSIVAGETVRRVRTKSKGVYGADEIGSFLIANVDSGEPAKFSDYMSKKRDGVVLGVPGAPTTNYTGPADEGFLEAHLLKKYLSGLSGVAVTDGIARVSSSMEAEYFRHKTYTKPVTLTGSIIFTEDSCGQRSWSSTGTIATRVDPDVWPLRMYVDLNIVSSASAGTGGQGCAPTTWTGASTTFVVQMTSPYADGTAISDTVFETPEKDRIIANGWTYFMVVGDFKTFHGVVEQYDRFGSGLHLGTSKGTLALAAP